MKKALLAVSCGIVFSSSVFAGSPHPGFEFHEEANCIKCHSAESKNPYNRNKSDSFPKLVKAVQFCNDNLNAGWFEDEVEMVADYLNQEYYYHPKD